MVNRLSRYNLLLALSATLLSSVAWAQAPQKERVALHPCVIVGNKKVSLESLQTDCVTAAVREAYTLVPSTEINAFLEQEKAQAQETRKPKGKAARKEVPFSCANRKTPKERDACLGRLAAATQASRALLINITFTYAPGKAGRLKGTRISGRVLDASGHVTEEKQKDLILPSPPPPETEIVRSAVSQLLDQLEVARPPAPLELIPAPLTGQPAPEPEPAPMVAQPTPAAPPLKAEPPPPPPPRGRTWMTPGGLIAGGVGVVAMGVAGSFLLSADKKAKDFNAAFEGQLPTEEALPGLLQMREDGLSQRKNGKTLMVVGGALTAVGGVLFGIDTALKGKPSAPQAGTARILAGPNQVGVLVLLP